MSIFMMGGWMMWPLALVSITVTTIVIERLLFYSSCRFPPADFSRRLELAARGNRASLLEALRDVPLLAHFSVLAQLEGPAREATLRIEGEAVAKRLEKFLPTLAILGRLAPLLGLLGTVLGMITTFSQIADVRSGLNMNQLAGGIWQALLTTAAGLGIAIPALFFSHQFQRRVDRICQAMSDAANILLIPAQPGAMPEKAAND